MSKVYDMLLKELKVHDKSHEELEKDIKQQIIVSEWQKLSMQTFFKI